MSPANLLSLLSHHERRHLAIVLGLIMVSALLEAASVTAMYPFLLVASRPTGTPLPALAARLQALADIQGAREFLLAFGTAILALVILTNLVGAYTTWRQQRFVRAFEHGLSVRLLRHFLYQKYPYFLRRNTGEIQRTLLQDTHDISDGALEPGLEIMARGVAALAIFLVLLVLQPVIAVVALVIFGAVYGAFYRVGRRHLQKAGQLVHEAFQGSAKVSGEALSVIKTLKVTHREDQFIERYRATHAVMARNYAKSTMFARMPRYVFEGALFTFLMIFFLAVLGSGKDLMGTLPVLGMFAFAGFRLMPAVHGVVAAAGRLRFSQTVVQAVAEELHRGAPTHGASVQPLPFAHDLRFEGVRFAYDSQGREILRGVDLNITKGTTVGIVGRTGSGKTTIMDLLLGLLEPTQGTIRVDGQVLTGDRIAQWQARVSYVPQQVVLIDDTVERNIAFGVPEEQIDRARVRAAAARANIDDFITQDLEKGYETSVGERGVRLSGGQRQRIGIARALYDDRDFLVFDEATSEVDAVTERAINEAIEAMAGRKTIVVVAHRFTAIRRCDQILMLDEGRVVATGSYEELLASQAPFKRLAEAGA